MSALVVEAASTIARGLIAGTVVLISLSFAYAFGAGYIPLGRLGLVAAAGVLMGGTALVLRLRPKP